MADAARFVLTCPECKTEFDAPFFGDQTPVCPKCGYPEDEDQEDDSG